MMRYNIKTEMSSPATTTRLHGSLFGFPKAHHGLGQNYVGFPSKYELVMTLCQLKQC